MQNAIVAAVVLVLIPMVYFGHRTGLLKRPVALWMAAIFSLTVLVWAWPRGGVDFVYLKRLNLFLCAAVVYVLARRRATGRRSYRSLMLLAISSLVVYLNFFSFHGETTFIHYHDVAHYYLGSKYFRELGYSDLYTAMLRAEAEIYDDHFKTIEARDLSTNELVHVRALLRRSGPVRAAFTPSRWEDFKGDVRFFRESLGRQYGAVLRDHGYNPTPFWTLIGGSLAELVPPGSAVGIALLTLLDPLLLVVGFVAIGWAFGLNGLLLGFIHFCLVFGTSFGWTGGAFLRYLWFFALIAAFCLLRKKSYTASGVLWAVATLLRVFPAFFVLALLLKDLGLSFRRRRPTLTYGRVYLGFVVAGLMGLSLTLSSAGGARSWVEFRQNTERQLATVSPNLVGLTGLLAHNEVPDKVTREEFRDIRERRSRIYRLQLAALLPLGILLIIGMSQRSGDLGAASMAVLLILFALNLASYYYVFLILLTLTYRGNSARTAVIFAVECSSYCLMLFEDREAMLNGYRSLLVLYLFIDLYWNKLRWFGLKMERVVALARGGSYNV